MVKSMPMIAVSDVLAASRWYQVLLGARSDHGGCEYDKIISGDSVLLQLHKVDSDHPHLGCPSPQACGVVLWFEVTDFDAALMRVRKCAAVVLEPEHRNPFSNQREIWLKDLDGHRIVLSG